MYLVGNWKMTGSRAFATSHLAGVIHAIKMLGVTEDCHIIHCPPLIWLCDALRQSQGSPVQIGAQNCHYDDKGAYTGEISPAMLKEAGCHYVIIGHSERRQYCHETDDIVAEKIRSTLEHKLEPILCIGEKQQQRLSGNHLKVLKTQLAQVFPILGQKQRLIVAYEPVWAIGAKRTPTMQEIEESCAFIAELLKSHGVMQPIILYGGSVNAANSADILSLPSVGGVLVGGASVNLEEWTGIMKAAMTVKKQAA